MPLQDFMEPSEVEVSSFEELQEPRFVLRASRLQGDRSKMFGLEYSRALSFDVDLDRPVQRLLREGAVRREELYRPVTNQRRWMVQMVTRATSSMCGEVRCCTLYNSVKRRPVSGVR